MVARYVTVGLLLAGVLSAVTDVRLAGVFSPVAGDLRAVESRPTALPAQDPKGCPTGCCD